MTAAADEGWTDEAWLLYARQYLEYTDAKILPGDRYAAVSQMLFTAAIITGQIGDTDGYADRWCYGTPWAAAAALEAWDGQGEPGGWHRHPRSGRRVAGPEGGVDVDGNRVGPGEVYVYP